MGTMCNINVSYNEKDSSPPTPGGPKHINMVQEYELDNEHVSEVGNTLVVDIDNYVSNELELFIKILSPMFIMFLIMTNV